MLLRKKAHLNKSTFPYLRFANCLIGVAIDLTSICDQLGKVAPINILASQSDAQDCSGEKVTPPATGKKEQMPSKIKGSKLLEPCAVKAACTVLRGGKFVKTDLSQHVQNNLYQGFESLRLQRVTRQRDDLGTCIAVIHFL